MPTSEYAEVSGNALQHGRAHLDEAQEDADASSAPATEGGAGGEAEGGR